MLGGVGKIEIGEDPENDIGAGIDKISKEILKMLGWQQRHGTMDKTQAEMQDDGYGGIIEVSEMQ